MTLDYVMGTLLHHQMKLQWRMPHAMPTMLPPVLSPPVLLVPGLLAQLLLPQLLLPQALLPQALLLPGLLCRLLLPQVPFPSSRTVRRKSWKQTPTSLMQGMNRLMWFQRMTKTLKTIESCLPLPWVYSWPEHMPKPRKLQLKRLIQLQFFSFHLLSLYRHLGNSGRYECILT
jgi:hypothetical protein